MEKNHFNITFLVEQTPSEVFNAIKNVGGWWSEELEGNSENLNDEFSYRHGDFHYSKHKLVEVIPNKKIVWLTLDSKLTFVEKQDEWNGTKIIFEISKQGNNTKLNITHFGLVPEFQCYDGCSKGWTYYLQNSLLQLITTGQGKPDQIKK
jgi:Activator of Hsp90 ATPase homolog 1-like protein